MTDPLNIKGSRILFVTGRFAEASLRSVVSDLSERLGFRYEIAVPGIQVAALLHTKLLRRRLTIDNEIDRVILPGWCQGNLQDLETQFGKPFERGPKNLHDLPQYFGLVPYAGGAAHHRGAAASGARAHGPGAAAGPGQV